MPDSQTGSVLKLTFTLWWIPQSSVSSPRLLCYATRGARNREIPWKHYYRLKEWSPGLLYVVRGCTIITRKAERKSEFSSIKLYVVIYFSPLLSHSRLTRRRAVLRGSIHRTAPCYQQMDMLTGRRQRTSLHPRNWGWIDIWETYFSM